MENRNSDAKSAEDNSSKIQQTREFPSQRGDTVDKLLLEKVPIAGISRVTGISEPWLQRYINQKYKDTPKKLETVKKKAN